MLFLSRIPQRAPLSLPPPGKPPSPVADSGTRRSCTPALFNQQLQLATWIQSDHNVMILTALGTSNRIKIILAILWLQLCSILLIDAAAAGVNAKISVNTIHCDQFLSLRPNLFPGLSHHYPQSAAGKNASHQP